MQTQMIIGRVLFFILAVIIATYISFECTPELDGVKNAWMYRLSFMMVWLRGLAFLMFDAFNLFPIVGD